MDFVFDFINFTNSFMKPKYPTVNIHDEDVFHLLEINKFGAVVAGGAALSWFQGNEVGPRDIDLWFRESKNLEKMSNHLHDVKEARLSYDTDNAETWKIELKNKEYQIQLIKNRLYSDVYDLFNVFDITVCQVATDGFSWWYGDNFLQDLNNKRLRIIKTTPNSMKRLIKYWSYGFQPTDEDLEMIKQTDHVIWKFDNNASVEDYENAF